MQRGSTSVESVIQFIAYLVLSFASALTLNLLILTGVEREWAAQVFLQGKTCCPVASFCRVCLSQRLSGPRPCLPGAACTY